MLKRVCRRLRLACSVSDEDAMLRVRDDNDSAAFARLVARWETPVRRLCFRMTGNWQDAEDLGQEAFTRLFARRKHYQPTARFSSYVWRIAINLCHDHGRRSQRRRTATSDMAAVAEAESTVESAEAIVGRGDEVDRVRAALCQLPEIYREVIVLRHYEQLRFREVAEVLEIPEGTVSSRMAEALRRLTRLLADGSANGDGSPAKEQPTLNRRPAP